MDPGFIGKLLFTVYNAGPNDILLERSKPVFMIMFAILTKKVEDAYEGEHQYQLRIKSDDVARLHGTPVSPKSLDERVKKVELWLYVLTAVVIPIIASLLIAVLTRMGGT